MSPEEREKRQSADKVQAARSDSNTNSSSGNANGGIDSSTASTGATKNSDGNAAAAVGDVEMKDNRVASESGNDKDRQTLKDPNAKMEIKPTCNNDQQDDNMKSDTVPIQEKEGHGENNGCKSNDSTVNADKIAPGHSTSVAENIRTSNPNVAARTVTDETTNNKENEVCDGGENDDSKDDHAPSQQQQHLALSLSASPAPEVGQSKSENENHTASTAASTSQEAPVHSAAEVSKNSVANDNTIISEPPSTSTENSNTNEKMPIHPDRQRAALLLAHRRMILHRLRQCRRAADERLKEYQSIDRERNLEHKKKEVDGATEDDEKADCDEIDKKKENKIVAPLLPLKSNQQSKQQLQVLQKHKDLYQQKIYDTRNDEVSAYKELSSFAMSFTNRRQSSSGALVGAGGGSLRNISLRTGSSVGNKMKAAVATLTNNVGWVSSSSMSSENNNLGNSGALDLGGSTALSTSQQEQEQQQGEKVNLPQHNKLNTGTQQPQNQQMTNPEGGNIAAGNINVSSKQQKHHHGNNGVKSTSKNLPASSKTVTTNVQLPQNTIKSSNTSATAGPILPTASSFNNSKKEIKQQPSAAIGDDIVVNGPLHQQQPQPPLSSLSPLPLPTGKQLKKKGKGRRSSSKRSLSANSTMPTSSIPTNDNSSRSASINLPLHHGVMNSNNNTSSKNATGTSAGSWNQNAPNNTGQYPLHTLSSSAMDHNAQYRSSNFPVVMQQHFPPRSLCPETDRLRKKRRLIEAKLESIFKKRYMASVLKESSTTNIKFLPQSASSIRQNGLNSGMIVSSPKSSTFDPTGTASRKMKQPIEEQQLSSFQQPLSSVLPNENPYIRHPSSVQRQHKPPLSWKNYMSLGGYTPCLLPQRQKTHWDNVLGEMRWLATDFIEERKWKEASARTISCSVSACTSSNSASSSPLRTSSKTTSICSSTRSFSNATSSTMSSKSSSEIKNTSSDVKLVEIEREATKFSNDADYNRKGVGGIEEEEASMEGESSEVENQSVNEIKYEDPSEDDLKRAKSISKIISTVVEDNWEMMVIDADASPRSNQVSVSAFSKFRLMYDTLDAPGTHTDKSSDLEDVKNEDVKKLKVECKRQSSYENISSGMESSLEFAVKLRSNLPSAYEKYEGGLSKSLDGIGIELHVSQIKCLQFVESILRDNARVKTSGLLLNGPIASGKTFSTCALLWRRRNNGPQLLICPSASLVSFVCFLIHSHGIICC